jgi:hypothetical protein
MGERKKRNWRYKESYINPVEMGERKKRNWRYKESYINPTPNKDKRTMD